LTHTVDRLEACGLVERSRCDDDRRGTWAGLTEAGRAKLVEMAPVHVASVRRHLIDPVARRHLAGWGAALAEVRTALPPR
jgi:DNA-binding MarR family transcriptional regulator